MLLNGQFLSSTGSLVFGKQADLCQVRCALNNKFLRVNGFTILLEDNLMSLLGFIHSLKVMLKVQANALQKFLLQ